MGGEQRQDDKLQRTVETWLANAWQNAKLATSLAKKPGYQALALHMTQQSMECAAKGISLNMRVPHKRLKNLSHNNLELFVECYGIILQQTKSAPYVDELLVDYTGGREELKANSQVQNLLNLTTTPGRSGNLSEDQKKAARAFYHSALTIPPEEVRGMLDMLASIRGKKNLWRQAIAQVASSPLSLSRPEGKESNLESISLQVGDQVTERLAQINLRGISAASCDGIIRHFVAMATKKWNQTQVRSELERMNWQVTLTKRNADHILMTSFEIPITFTEMLVVSSLVWPHEPYTRYPAPPSAIDLTYGEAAKRPGQLGSGHYSSEVGAIKYIKNLADLAKKITACLKKSHRSGLLFTPLDE